MKRHRILIIDINEVWRDHIAQALRLLGHEVSTAASCAEGQALAATMAPELVVIDINFPSLAGLTLIECLTMNGGRSGSGSGGGGAGSAVADHRADL